MSMCADVLFQLAPSLPLQEDFVYHWKAITHYYIETSGENLFPQCDVVVCGLVTENRRCRADNRGENLNEKTQM